VSVCFDYVFARFRVCWHVSLVLCIGIAGTTQQRLEHEGNLAFVTAVQQNMLDVVSEMLLKDPGLVNVQQTRNGVTALISAVNSGHMNMARMLLGNSHGITANLAIEMVLCCVGSVVFV
jgi:hypothetical protein